MKINYVLLSSLVRMQYALVFFFVFLKMKVNSVTCCMSGQEAARLYSHGEVIKIARERHYGILQKENS